jgi:hypothetical protein
MSLRIAAIFRCDGIDCVANNPEREFDITPEQGMTVTLVDAATVYALRVPDGGWRTNNSGELLCPWCAADLRYGLGRQRS